MNKIEYLGHSAVSGFIEWAYPLLDTPGALVHEYVSIKTKSRFRCVSLYDAYQNYSWTAGFDGPDGRRYSGKSLEENEQLLDMLSCSLRESVSNGDANKCLRTCIAIQDWGGTRRNIDTLNKIGEEIVDYLREMMIRLDTESFELGERRSDKSNHMTSGFSKIYALLLDDFLIYDSRVSAALCMLVRRFCLEKDLPAVPEPLKFALGLGRSAANRDPSCSKYKFSKLTYVNSNNYLDNNMRSNWLMSGLLDFGSNRFLDLPRNKRLLALGNALFMIGYEV